MKSSSGTLAVPGSLDSISQIRSWLAELLRQWSIPDEIISDVQTAVTEICTNLVRHGYRDDNPGEISLEAVLEAQKIAITITDEAPAFVPESDVNLPRQRLAEGGYGLFMVHSLMDEVNHEALGETGNKTTVIKHVGTSLEGL